MKYPALSNYLDGQAVPFTGERADVISPLDGTPLSRVPLSGAVEVDAAMRRCRPALALVAVR